MNKPATLSWFAKHEFGLFWRDWHSIMTAGRANRERILAAIVAVVGVFMHMLAYMILAPLARDGIDENIAIFVFVGGTMALSISLMLSQAMESVTRAFYSRDDLDLIMSSPAIVRRLFAVRIAAISVTTLSMSLLLAFPFINILIYLDGGHWFAAYGILAAMAAATTAIAAVIIKVLFAIIGPLRTRLVAQFVAAIVGAGFVIGIQIVAIMLFGNISRLDVLTSGYIYEIAPLLDSWLWIPVRAMMGNGYAFVVTTLASFGLLWIVIFIIAPNFGTSVIAASGVSRRIIEKQSAKRQFIMNYPARALRHKEWTLLKRDPWLISQTLMQILYLLPPAFLLWRNFSSSANALAVIVPVLVMASGQLAGGLAWLAVSGEDAPDLISTAPIKTRTIIIAKIEAVMSSIAIVVAPLILALLYINLWTGIVAAIGIVVSSLSSIAIQLWFRKQARRSHFRRRQISSRAATFCEAFSSILWAGCAGVAVAGSWFAIILAVPALVVLAIARAIAPTQEQ